MVLWVNAWDMRYKVNTFGYGVFGVVVKDYPRAFRQYVRVSDYHLCP
jgi:hypothetical protein